MEMSKKKKCWGRNEYSAVLHNRQQIKLPLSQQQAGGAKSLLTALREMYEKRFHSCHPGQLAMWLIFFLKHHCVTVCTSEKEYKKNPNSNPTIPLSTHVSLHGPRGAGAPLQQLLWGKVISYFLTVGEWQRTHKKNHRKKRQPLQFKKTTD